MTSLLSATVRRYLARAVVAAGIAWVSVASPQSGTGFFLVYNDRRDTSEVTSDTLLGRSLILKYTRLFSM